jgi:hypothetical protein
MRRRERRAVDFTQCTHQRVAVLLADLAVLVAMTIFDGHGGLPWRGVLPTFLEAQVRGLSAARRKNENRTPVLHGVCRRSKSPNPTGSHRLGFQCGSDAAQCKTLDCLNLPLEVFALARQFVLAGFCLKNKTGRRAMAVALQINFGLWIMIGCAAIKAIQFVY